MFPILICPLKDKKINKDLRQRRFIWGFRMINIITNRKHAFVYSSQKDLLENNDAFSRLDDSTHLSFKFSSNIIYTI